MAEMAQGQVLIASSFVWRVSWTNERYPRPARRDQRGRRDRRLGASPARSPHALAHLRGLKTIPKIDNLFVPEERWKLPLAGRPRVRVSAGTLE